MKTKKTKKASLEGKRTSLFMIGMVCASSFALMSFEYSSFTLMSTNELEGKDKDIEEVVWAYTPPVIETPKPQPIERFNEEIIDVTPEPIPDPVPTPDPVPNPTPSPLPPAPTFTVPVPKTIPTIDNDVYTVVEQMPEFPGGIDMMYKFLSKNVNYPEISRENGSQGKVYVQFTVEKDGSISNVEIMKGVDKYINKESKRVVESMPKWKPGKQLNKAVRVNFVLPIDFKVD